MSASKTPTGGATKSEDKKLQVDLRAIIVRWAYNLYAAPPRTWRQRKLNIDKLEFDINWSKVKFVHSRPDYQPIASTDVPLEPPEEKSKILFETQFENRTSEDQHYSFKTERTTSSTCSVEVEQGVMKGYDASLTLKTPVEVLSVSGGFKREVTLNTTESETVVDEMTWGVDSQIKVKTKHRTTAKLVVEEECDKRSYAIHTDVYGHIKVDILKKKDHSHVTHVGGGFVDVIDHTKNRNDSKVLTVNRSPKDYPHPVVSYDSTGTATFKFGVKQRVDLDEEPLK